MKMKKKGIIDKYRENTCVSVSRPSSNDTLPKGPSVGINVIRQNVLLRYNFFFFTYVCVCVTYPGKKEKKNETLHVTLDH